MWQPVQAHVAKHAVFYAIAIGMGAQAFFTALYDNFWSLEPYDLKDLGWWQVGALICKSLSAPIAIVVGYLIKAPTHIVGDISSQTTSTLETKTVTQTSTDEKKP